MRLTDHAMNCCGIVQASSIIVEEKYNESTGNFEYPADSWDKLFNLIEEHQKKHLRNCAMISLSSVQREAMKQAEKRGYKRVFSFPNMNSHNDVHIYTKLLFETREDFHKAQLNKEYVLPDRSARIHTAPEVDHAV